MSYMDQYQIQSDHNLHLRLTACAATQGVENPMQWVADRMWAFSAEPGWVEAYETAKMNEILEIGKDESVITDSMILSAVQSKIES